MLIVAICLVHQDKKELPQSKEEYCMLAMDMVREMDVKGNIYLTMRCAVYSKILQRSPQIHFISSILMLAILHRPLLSTKG